MSRTIGVRSPIGPELLDGLFAVGGRAGGADALGRSGEGPRVPRLADVCAECLASADAVGAGEGPVFFVPGRVEVLGKHTDYAGGRSLIAALDRGICVAARARPDGAVVVMNAQSGESATFELSAALRPIAGWARYPMTVARRVARDFPGPLAGASMAFASDLPPAAGMSSSSALVTATFLALAAVNRLDRADLFRTHLLTREDLAEYLAAIESGRTYRGLDGDDGVGTSGGSQDHTAILCARVGALAQYAFAPARFERAVPVPTGLTFTIAASGVAAEKTGAARRLYNRAVEQMWQATELWRAATGRTDEVLGAVLDSGPEAVDRLRRVLRGAGGQARDVEHSALRARVDQFVEESSRIVPNAAAALSRGDLAEFGDLVDRSQELAVRSLGNQIPETIELARSARSLGAVAASAFGAGFGGSVWALVEEASAGAFVERWRSAYIERFPDRAAAAAFFSSRPDSPARRLA